MENFHMLEKYWIHKLQTYRLYAQQLTNEGYTSGILVKKYSMTILLMPTITKLKMVIGSHTSDKTIL